MSRWGPDADDRLYRSAMQLIFERGYEQVTVAEIAEHAGLKKRSFFRHYADKREVLFAGAADFQQSIMDAAHRAPADQKPIDVVIAALAEGGAGLVKWGEPVRRRQQIIATSTELRERELIKMDDLTTALAEALRQRDVEAPTATLVAQVGVAVFSTAFQRWTESEEPQDFSSMMNDAVERMRSALAG